MSAVWRMKQRQWTTPQAQAHCTCMPIVFCSMLLDNTLPCSIFHTFVKRLSGTIIWAHFIFSMWFADAWISVGIYLAYSSHFQRRQRNKLRLNLFKLFLLISCAKCCYMEKKKKKRARGLGRIRQQCESVNASDLMSLLMEPSPSPCLLSGLIFT